MTVLEHLPQGHMRARSSVAHARGLTLAGCASRCRALQIDRGILSSFHWFNRIFREAARCAPSVEAETPCGGRHLGQPTGGVPKARRAGSEQRSIDRGGTRALCCSNTAVWSGPGGSPHLFIQRRAERRLEISQSLLPGRRNESQLGPRAVEFLKGGPAKGRIGCKISSIRKTVPGTRIEQAAEFDACSSSMQPRIAPGDTEG